MANTLRTSGVFSLGSLSSDNAFEEPSLDLNFDGQLSSFTRATTYPNAPKANGDQLATSIVTQNKTGTVQSKYMGPNGTLINGYVENLLPHSSVASWTPTAGSISATASSVTDPLGGTGAYRVDDQDGAAWQSMDINATVAGNTWATLSIYIHASDNTSTKLGFNINYSGGATFPRLTIVNGVPSTPSNDQTGHSSYTGTVAQVAGTDWYRWEIPFDFGVSSISFYPAVAAASSTGYVTVFGAQLELGGAASQLVQTSGATASAQVPRVEFDANGNPLGLLVEEERENLMTSTDNVGGTGWTSGNFTINSSYNGTTPDGTSSSSEFVYNPNGGFTHAYMQVSVANNTDTYTASIWYKGSGYFRFGIQEVGVSAGSFTNTPNLTATSDWQRATITRTNQGTGSGALRLSIISASDSLATNGIEFWGAQLEQGEAATSYIPNTATTGTKTRTADDITLATSAFGFDTGTMTTVIDATISSPSHDYARFFEINNNNSSSPRHAVMLDPTNGSRFQWRDDVNGSASDAYVAMTVPLSVKIGTRTDGTTGSYAVDGAVTTHGTIPAMTSPVTQVVFGSQGATAHMNGHIRRFTYFPRAISDASLASYTGANRPTQELIRPTRKWGGMLGRTLTTDVDKAPVVDHSLRFESSDADFLTQASQVTATDSDKWTLSVWIKVASNGGLRTIISGGENNAPLYLDANNNLAFYEYNGSSVQLQFNTYETITVADGWTHVVMSVDYASSGPNFGDKVKVWIDGTAATLNVTTPPSNWNLQGNNASALNGTTYTQAGTYPYRYIGRKTNSLGRYFPGQMSEFHFVDGTALTAATFGEYNASGQWVPREVAGGFSYGTNGFYLPFDRREEGVTLLLDGEGASIADTSSNSGSNVSVGSSVSQSALESKNGVKSLRFTPTSGAANSYISYTGPELPGDFTVEMWWRPDALPNADEMLLEFRSASNTGNPLLYYSGATQAGTISLYIPSTNVITSTASLTAQTWYHVALVRSSGTYELFIDGVSQGTHSNSTSINSGTQYIGRRYQAFNSNYYGLNGYIDDFRLTAGIARDIAAEWTAGTYTSSLTNDIKYGSLGRDATTNSNDFTVPANTLTPDDQLIDSPNLRFATWDPSFSTGIARTLSEGNLWLTTDLNNFSPTGSTQPMSSGKYYAEFLAGDANRRGCVGVCEATYAFSGTDRAYQGSDNNVVMRDYDGHIYANLSAVSSNTVTITHNSTVIGVALDLDSTTKTVKWYLDGTLHYTYTLTSPPSMRFSAGDISGSYTAIVKANFGQDHTFAGTKSPLSSPYTDSDGNGEFYYQPPAGYRALTTKIVGSDTVLQSTGVISLAEHYQSKL